MQRWILCPVPGAEGDAVKLLVTSMGVLVVLAWALHEIVFLHEKSMEEDAEA